ncbi:MAG: hypothetical protein ACREFX_10875 [Opitutaceae bacterium]
MPFADSAHLHFRPFEVEFGKAAACLYRSGLRAGLRVPVPVLGAETRERFWPEAAPAGVEAGFDLYTSGDLLIGCAAWPAGEDPTEAARRLYLRLLDAAAGGHLYRVWNYVPGINGSTGDLENYRAFCVGRGAAFEERWGPAFAAALPAASAVGCAGGALAAVFVAGREPPLLFENPEQVPAYEYPPDYGPRAPSFARASVAIANGRRMIFISGTAAIKGHATVAPESLEAQIACTLDNLHAVGREAGAGADLGISAGFARSFKIYVRHPDEFGKARSRIREALLRPGDSALWLRADLCRRALRIEIEATLVGVPR